MRNPLIKLALILWIVAVILWFIEDRGGVMPITDLPNYVFYAGCGLIAISIFYTILGILLGIKQKTEKNKCIRCGRKVAVGMIYCPVHLKEAKAEAIEKRNDGVV